MDDIVTRLREGLWHNDCCDSPSCGGDWFTPLEDKDFIEAADEIERLRKQAELWKRAARCWQAVAYGGSTISAEQARDAITEAEDYERRV